MPAAADPVLLALHRHGVRRTPMRQAVLGILLRSPFALARADIEQQLPVATDRITLYRTLRTFEAKGLVHRVLDHSDTMRYAACADALPPDVALPAAATHVHLKCTACQHIYCLSQVAVPAVTLPAQYRVVRGDHLLLGLCEQCQTAPRPLEAEQL